MWILLTAEEINKRKNQLVINYYKRIKKYMLAGIAIGSLLAFLPAATIAFPNKLNFPKTTIDILQFTIAYVISFVIINMVIIVLLLSEYFLVKKMTTEKQIEYFLKNKQNQEKMLCLDCDAYYHIEKTNCDRCKALLVKSSYYKWIDK